jgi:hypothetical protein
VEATLSDKRVDVDVMDYPGTSSEEERETGIGFAEMYRGEDSVTVGVEDRAAARAMLGAFGG